MIIWDWLKNKKLIDISLKRRKEDNVVVVYGKNLEICYLNKVGGEILMYATSGITIEEISKKLLSKYEVYEKDLQNDMIEIIREMQWKRIVRLEE